MDKKYFLYEQDEDIRQAEYWDSEDLLKFITTETDLGKKRNIIIKGVKYIATFLEIEYGDYLYEIREVLQ